MDWHKRFQTLYQNSSEMNKYNIQRNHFSQLLYKSSVDYFDYDYISSFTDSPTAMSYKKAFEIFAVAYDLLTSYPKQTVDSEEDCDYLQPAFHGYAEGEMCENHLFVVFAPPQISMELLNQYLILRPNDILSEYFKVCFMRKQFLLTSSNKQSKLSEYKRMRKILSAHEKFALKLERNYSCLNASEETLLKLAVDVNFMLGSHYAITDQNIRALDSFKKSYNYDTTDLTSMYGVAFYQHFFNPNESIRLLNVFLEKAPKCHKRYYDAFYTLSFLYARRGDLGKAIKCYRLGEQAEGYQLPFLVADITWSKENARMLLQIFAN